MVSVDEAKRLLGVGDVFTARVLKQSFRRQAFFCHSDHGGSDKAFMDLKEAYELLGKFVSPDGFDSGGNGSDSLRTVGGRPLSELGKGLPITTSAKPCEMCEGRGWTKFRTDEKVTKDCPSCNGEGMYFVPCKRCDGSGQYTHPESKRVVGECYQCGGSGKFYPPKKERSGRDAFYRFQFHSFFTKYVTLKNGKRIPVNDCRACRGTGKVEVDAPIDENMHWLYYTCDGCSGVGEIEIWNPVIPRGLIIGNKEEGVK